jgi:hypothetical protein
LSSNRFQKLAAQLGFGSIEELENTFDSMLGTADPEGGVKSDVIPSKSTAPSSTVDLLGKALQDMDAAESQSSARKAFQDATDALAEEEAVSLFCVWVIESKLQSCLTIGLFLFFIQKLAAQLDLAVESESEAFAAVMAEEEAVSFLWCICLSPLFRLVSQSVRRCFSEIGYPVWFRKYGRA